MLELNLSHYNQEVGSRGKQGQCTLNHAELNIFWNRNRQKVMLRFSDPVLASMIRGKNEMHLDGTAPLTLGLPGESVIPSGNELLI